jgi:hypothetical protein
MGFGVVPRAIGAFNSAGMKRNGKTFMAMDASFNAV